MINRVYILFIIITITSFCYGQNNPDKNHPLTNLTCKTCHSCDVPTRKDPCLNPCPRAKMTSVNESPDKAPEVEILKELSERYQPVVFPHKLHAQMSEMSGGCQTCHHYNTIGPIQSCINCHTKKRSVNDLGKPNLQAAYHQQCINCHREWSHKIDCTSCHAEKNNKETVDVNSSVQQIAGKSHPKIEVPKKIVFETNYKKGSLVTFYHDEHVNRFDIKCINCHQNENCTRCHDKDKATMNPAFLNGKPIKIHKTAERHHQPCFSCHQDDQCTTCHKNKEAGSFSHLDKTGWALNSFHQKLSCSKCHGTSGKFEKLNPKCTNCHNNFVQGKFNHSVTGLKLNDNHADLDCDNCHENKDFSKPPSCKNCHDNKNFPKDKPGKLVSIKN